MSHPSSFHSLGTQFITLQQSSRLLVGRSQHFDRLKELVHKVRHRMTGQSCHQAAILSREETSGNVHQLQNSEADAHFVCTEVRLSILGAWRL